MGNLKQITLLTLSLVTVTIVMTGLVVLVNSLTEERIANIIYADLITAKQEIFPEAGDFTRESIIIENEPVRYYIAGSEGYVFITTSIGYGGEMTVVTGIDSEGRVIDVRVTEHEETPGLGTRIFDDEFTHQFHRIISDEKFVVGENIDGVSGSTITVNALVIAVNEALAIYWEVR